MTVEQGTQLPIASEGPVAGREEPRGDIKVGPGRVISEEPLQASVRLRYIDPWSVFKLSTIISVALLIVWIVGAGLLYLILELMGVWDRLNSSIFDVVGSQGSASVSPIVVLIVVIVVGLINAVIFPIFTTILAYIYNCAAQFVSGIGITLVDHFEGDDDSFFRSFSPRFSIKK